MNDDAFLELRFETDPNGIALQATVFAHPLLAEEQRAVRGRVPRNESTARTRERDVPDALPRFPWRRQVVVGFIAYLVRVAAWGRAEKAQPMPTISGGPGSLAAKLDRAIQDKPEWLFSIFGETPGAGSPFISSIINHRKQRAGNSHVAIAIRPDQFNPAHIDVYVDDHRIDTEQALLSIAARLDQVDSEPGAKRSRDPLVPMARFVEQLDGQHAALSLRAPNVPLRRPQHEPPYSPEEAELAGAFLEFRSQLHYQHGKFRNSFADNIAASHYFEQARDHGRSIRALSHCMSNLRPLDNAPLLRRVTHLAAERITKTTGALFMERAWVGTMIGATCFEYGDIAASRRFFVASAEFMTFTRERQECSCDSRSLTKERCLNDRRIAYDIGMESSVLDVTRMIELSNELSDYGFTSDSGNCFVAAINLLAAHGHDRRVVDFYYANENAVSQSSRWSQVVALSVVAALLKRLGSKNRADRLAEQAFRMAIAHEIVQPHSNTVGGHPLLRPDWTLGIDHPLVRKYGSLRPRGPSPYSTEDLQKFYELVDVKRIR